MLSIAVHASYLACSFHSQRLYPATVYVGKAKAALHRAVLSAGPQSAVTARHWLCDGRDGSEVA